MRPLRQSHQSAALLPSWRLFANYQSVAREILFGVGPTNISNMFETLRKPKRNAHPESTSSLFLFLTRVCMAVQLIAPESTAPWRFHNVFSAPDVCCLRSYRAADRLEDGVVASHENQNLLKPEAGDNLILKARLPECPRTCHPVCAPDGGGLLSAAVWCSAFILHQPSGDCL